MKPTKTIKYLNRIEKRRNEAMNALDGAGDSALYSMLVEQEIPKLIKIARDFITPEQKTIKCPQCKGKGELMSNPPKAPHAGYEPHLHTCRHCGGVGRLVVKGNGK